VRKRVGGVGEEQFQFQASSSLEQVGRKLQSQVLTDLGIMTRMDQE